MVTQTFEITSTGSLTGVDKIDVLDWGTIQSLPVSKLVSFEYNRPVREPHWKKIAKHFNPSECDALVVNRRTDGTLALIDGQHRKMALLSVFGSDATWPCRVVRNLSFQQEAEMFRALNEQRKPVTPVERFHAALLAQDDEAVAIERMVMHHGYKLLLNGSHMRRHNGSGVIVAVGTLLKIYRTYRDGTLDEVLGIIREAYGTKVGPSGEVLYALAMFVSSYREEFDRERLLLTLKRLPLASWEQESREFTKVMGGSASQGARHILVKHYNKGLRKKLSNTAEIG
jgi:hypothetical protein